MHAALATWEDRGPVIVIGKLESGGIRHPRLPPEWEGTLVPIQEGAVVKLPERWHDWGIFHGSADSRGGLLSAAQGTGDISRRWHATQSCRLPAAEAALLLALLEWAKKFSWCALPGIATVV